MAMENFTVRMEKEMKEEILAVAKALGFKSASEFLRAWWSRPEFYTPAIIEEKEKLHESKIKTKT